MHPHIFGRLLAALWIAFAITWAISAFYTKGYVHRTARSPLARIAAILVILGLLRIRPMRHFVVGVQRAIWSPAIASLGLALVVLGIGFAAWARVEIGRNWGTPMSLKQDAELITTGLYAYVRHPIYGGILLAMLGSTLVSIWCTIPLILFAAYFVWSAKTEERIMGEQFPQRYPNYMKRTKMFIPFVY